MGRTSSTVKDRYNAKAYDEIKVRVGKGQKETIQAHAEAHSESVNGFINRAISETMERDSLQEAVGGPTRRVEAGGVSLPYEDCEAAPAASEGQMEANIGKVAEDGA